MRETSKFENTVLLAIVWTFLTTSSLQAYVLPKPLFPTTKPTAKELIKTRRYSIMDYTPPVKVKLIPDRSQGSYATPEQTIISSLSAKHAIDPDWDLESWTKASRAYLKKELFGRLGITRDKRLAAWKAVFPGTNPILKRRVNLASHVVIEWKNVSAKGSTDEDVMSLALKLEEGKWKLMQDFKITVSGFNWWQDEQAARSRLDQVRQTLGVLSYEFRTLSEKEAELADIQQAIKVPKPDFPTTKPIHKEMVETYRFSLMKYEPPVAVKLQSQVHVVYATPEEAVIAHLSAMYAGDFAWYLKGWTRSAQQYMKNEVFEPSTGRLPRRHLYFTGETPEFKWYFEGWPKEMRAAKRQNQGDDVAINSQEMVAAWKKGLQDTRVELIRRVNRGQYVIIEYAVISTKNGRQLSTFSIPLQKKGRTWRVTQGLRSDPVFHYWNNNRAAQAAGYAVHMPNGE